MSILIINKTPYSHSPYDIWLQELGEDVVMLTTTSYAAEGANHGKIETFSHYETNGALEIRAMELHETYQFRAIIAMSEHDILRAAKLRERLGIQGQSWESATAFRNKLIMKKLVRECGLKVPHFAPVESAADLYAFIQAHGYPVVVKPIFGMGSVQTAVLRNRKELLDYAAGGLRGNLQVETYVEGEMYHIDGLILHKEMVYCWPSKYINGCLAFQNERFLGSYQLSAENPLTHRLIEFVSHVLRALPVPETTTFHAEVFHTPEDELVFCEIASRTGGAMVGEAIKQGFGFDMNKMSVQAQCGLTEEAFANAVHFKEPKILSGWLLMPPKKGMLKEVPVPYAAKWVKKQSVYAKPGQVFAGPAASVDAIANFCVVGSTEEQIAGRIQEIAVWFEQSAVWGDQTESVVRRAVRKMRRAARKILCAIG